TRLRRSSAWCRASSISCPSRRSTCRGASTTSLPRPKRWPPPDARFGDLGGARGVRRRGRCRRRTRVRRACRDSPTACPLHDAFGEGNRQDWEHQDPGGGGLSSSGIERCAHCGTERPPGRLLTSQPQFPRVVPLQKYAKPLKPPFPPEGRL